VIDTELALVITGNAGSAVKVSWSVDVAERPPSVTVKVAAGVPGEVGDVTVPEINPVTGLALNPKGRPLALNRAARVAPDAITWKVKGRFTLPVALALLVMIRVGGVGVPVAVGVGLGPIVGDGHGTGATTVIVSTRQPIPATVQSLPMRKRSRTLWPAAALGKLAVVVM
jgi:hypothetical protein